MSLSASESISPSASVSPSASASPSAAAPTSNYDIRLLDQHGYDVLEGVGANRSATATQEVPIIYANTSLHPVVHETDTLTLVIDNHAAPSAQIQINLYVANGY